MAQTQSYQRFAGFYVGEKTRILNVLYKKTRFFTKLKRSETALRLGLRAFFTSEKYPNF